MIIDFKTRKLMKVFNNEALLVRDYGRPLARKIIMRMVVLSAAPSLKQVPIYKPERCHALKGKRKGQFAVDLTGNCRLVFEPNHTQLPISENNELILNEITAIKILQVEDYH